MAVKTTEDSRAHSKDGPSLFSSSLHWKIHKFAPHVYRVLFFAKHEKGNDEMGHKRIKHQGKTHSEYNHVF